MNILDQLEARILQLLDNMSLMQMEIDELTDKNQYLQSKIAQADELEAEVTKIRAEQAFWHERLQKLLGKIDDVAASEESLSSSDVTLNTSAAHSNEDDEYPKIDSSQLSQLNDEKEPFFEINQNFTPDDQTARYPNHQS